MDTLIGLLLVALGGLTGWALRARYATGERLRVAEAFEGRTRMAEKDLELAQRELLQSRQLMRRIQDEHGDQSPELSRLKQELEVQKKELSALRRELLDRDAILERFEADDLALLPGVGPVLEGRLKEVGVRCFEDLAALDEAALQGLAERLNIPLRTIKRHDWPSCAAKLIEERGLPTT